MNAEISETIQATILGLGMQIPAHRKFISAECHALDRPTTTLTPTNLKKS